MIKELLEVAPKTDFFWIFFANKFDGFIDRLINNNISNFILDHIDLKLNYVNVVAVPVV